MEYEKLSGVEKEDENVDENKDDKKKKQRWWRYVEEWRQIWRRIYRKSHDSKKCITSKTISFKCGMQNCVTEGHKILLMSLIYYSFMYIILFLALCMLDLLL